MPSIASILSRRVLLAGLGAAGAAAAGGGVVQFISTDELSQLLRPRGKGRRNVRLATAERDDWSNQIGTLFVADTGQVLKLTDVQGFAENDTRPKHLRSSAFVARFTIKSGGPMESDKLQRFAHSEGGTFDMVMSAGSDPTRMHAIFN